MHKNDGKKSKRGFIVCVASGVAVSILTAVLLLALAAAFVVSGKIPRGAMPAAAAAAAFIGSFAGALAAIRAHKARRLVTGMTVSVCMCGMSLVITAFSTKGILLGGTNLLLLAAFFAGGLLSCVACTKRMGKRRRQR